MKYTIVMHRAVIYYNYITETFPFTSTGLGNVLPSAQFFEAHNKILTYKNKLFPIFQKKI